MDTGKTFFINDMKRLFGIILLFSGVAGLIPTVANVVNDLVDLNIDYELVLNSDTIKNNPLIKVDSFSLKIIPPSSGVQFYKDGIVFLSHSKTEGKMLPSHISFGNNEAYYAILNDSVLGNRTVFSPAASFTFPCEAITFNSDYTIMYFTKREGNRDTEKIYQAIYKVDKKGKGEWISDSQPLNICTDGSTYTNPSLSASGDIMIFASDRKGSVGGLDLYVTRKEGLNWSSPENLGNLINTNTNELSPFLDSENNLFFSSDGHQGFGGYDIFVSKYNGKGWDQPANLTQNINSPNDELAFTLNRIDGKSAFFTTRQKSGKLILQLFRVTFRNQYALKEFTKLTNAFTQLALWNKPSGEKTDTISTVPLQITPSKTEPIAEAVKKESVTGKVSQGKTLPEVKKEVKKVEAKETVTPVKPPVVVYRVQFVANSKPKGSYEITINGKIYKTYEYLYSGFYRTCVGEFTTLILAKNLQNTMRKEGHSQAFVVAFKNNERSLDPALFK